MTGQMHRKGCGGNANYGRFDQGSHRPVLERTGTRHQPPFTDKFENTKCLQANSEYMREKVVNL